MVLKRWYCIMQYSHGIEKILYNAVFTWYWRGDHNVPRTRVLNKVRYSLCFGMRRSAVLVVVVVVVVVNYRRFESLAHSNRDSNRPDSKRFESSRIICKVLSLYLNFSVKDSLCLYQAGEVIWRRKSTKLSGWIRIYLFYILFHFGLIWLRTDDTI